MAMDNFDDLHTDPIIAVSIMQELELSGADLEDPHKFSRLKHAIGFFSKLPEQNRESIFRRILSGKTDKLKIAWEYASLVEQCENTKKSLGEKMATLSSLETAKEDTNEIKGAVDELTKQVEFLSKEIQIYG